METNPAGMISIADLLKQQSKPQQPAQIVETHQGLSEKSIKFDEENI